MLLSDLETSSLKEGKNYKSLETIETEDINTKKMKEKAKAEYLRRTTKVVDSKFNSGNLFKTVNTWAVSVFCYSAASIDWKKDKIPEIYKRSRKLLTMHKAYDPKDDVRRLYIKGKVGDR